MTRALTEKENEVTWQSDDFDAGTKSANWETLLLPIFKNGGKEDRMMLENWSLHNMKFHMKSQ